MSSERQRMADGLFVCKSTQKGAVMVLGGRVTGGSDQIQGGAESVSFY